MSNEQIDQAIRSKRLYFIGEKLPADWYDAFRLWLPMAVAGDAKAQFNIGRCFSVGDGVDKDQAQSVVWLIKAAEQNEPRAHYNLYLHYKEIKDTTKAAEYLNKAAELGEQRALMEAGKKALGSGNKDQAKMFFKKAIDAGNDDAMLGLAACDIHITNLNGRHSNNGWNVSYTISNQSSIPVIFGINASQCEANNPDKLFGNSLGGSTIYIDPGLSLNAHILQSYGGLSNVAVLGFTLYSAYENKEINYESESYFPFATNIYVKKSGCFVLTACYGDHDAPTVMQYRQFRDNYLDKYEYGRKFIAWYYVNGPKWAEQIENMPRTKLVLRKFFKLFSYLLPR